MKAESRASGTISRRSVVQALGGMSAVGLAGCASNEGDGDGGGDGSNGDGGDGDGDGGDGGGQSDGDDLGERVPEPLHVVYLSDQASTPITEESAPILQENLEAALGIQVDVTGRDTGTAVGQIINDTREPPLDTFFSFSSMSPDRLDPDFITRRFAVDYAGGNGRLNLSNWANCDFSELAVGQASEGDPDARRELVYDAHEILSDDLVVLPIFRNIGYGAYNADAIRASKVGEAGIHPMNPDVYTASEPTDGDVIRMNGIPELANTRHHLTLVGGPALNLWNNLFYSPLRTYDENWELKEVLAETIDVEDEGRTVTVTLRDGATFHDGTPITAEDVQFTWEHLFDNADEFPQVFEPDGYEIEVVDDLTTVFTLESPFPPLLTRLFPFWGILPKEHWEAAGANEDPVDGYPDQIVGSGPFEVVDFIEGDFIEVEPHDGHPLFGPDHGLQIQIYRDGITAVESFMAGELDMVMNAPPSGISRIRDEMSNAEVAISQGFTLYDLKPQCNIAPTKFREFRLAMGMCLDRQLMNEVAVFGDSNVQLYCNPLADNHPWSAPEDRLTLITDDPTGDVEGAKQVLRDAGWGWDDDGNLRYPQDIDTEELWPAEGLPSPEDFPCIDEDGEYAE